MVTGCVHSVLNVPSVSVDFPPFNQDKVFMVMEALSPLFAALALRQNTSAMFSSNFFLSSLFISFIF